MSAFDRYSVFGLLLTAMIAARPASASGAEPAPADPHSWKSLFDGKTLAGWKVPNYGGEGKVEVKDGAIVIGQGATMSGISYTGEIPKINYELQLEGMRSQGTDFFATTTFPVGDTWCSFVTGGWGGTVVGLSTIDFYDASENPTSGFVPFKEKQWYRIRIRVTEKKIEAWLDDDKVVDFLREDHKIGIRFECETYKPLGVCTYTTEGKVRGIRLRTLKAEEVAEIAAEAQKQKDAT